MLLDDLDAAWEEIGDALVVRGILRFPALPSSSSVALWPDADWRTFLDVASATGAHLLYTVATVFDTDDIESLGDRLRRDDGTLSPEARAVVDDAAARGGSLVTVTLAFAADGILHVWQGQAAWWDQVTVQAEVEQMHAAIEANERAAAADAEWLAIESQADTWANELAGTRAFWQAGNDTARRTVAADLVPALAPLLAADRSTADGRRAHSFALAVVRDATRLARTEVLPRIEAEAFARLGALADQLRHDARHRAATTAEQRRRAARALLLDELGHATPALVDALARAAT